MQHQEFAPPEVLRDSIKCFWYNSRDGGAEQAAFEVVPDGYAEIIFHFGGGCSVLSNGVLKQLPSPFIMGLLNQPAVFYTKGRFEVIGIRCFPWTVFDMLGLQPGKGGVRVFEHPIAALQPVLNNWIDAREVYEAITVVQQYFLDARSQTAGNATLLKAGIAMTEAKGIMPVGAVAAAAHATVRTLERKFKQSSGYSVKDVSGLMRFEQVRNRLWHHPDANLAGLAAEFGYTDQSHLTREFKRYTGTTPATFARKAKNGKHGLPDFVAFVQA